VFAILILKRRIQQVLDRQILKAGEVYCIKNTEVRSFSTSKRFDAARPAERVNDRKTAKLVFGQVFLSIGHPDVIFFDERLPEAGFRTETAVAFARTLAEIDVRLKADGAAMASSVIRLFHRCPPAVTMRKLVDSQLTG
jgi:hypothetical protein